MKKETFITAVVFLGVGFLAGFAFNAHRTSIQRQRAEAQRAITSSQVDPGSATASSSTAPSPNAAPNGSSDLDSQLPKGHPPVSDAEVIQFFKDAAVQKPQDPAPRLKLADFYYDRRNFNEAITWYQQALALDPGDADARTDMATCFFNLGHAQEAVSQLRQALKSDPRHEPTLFNLVVVNMDGMHDFRAAAQALSELKVINPGYPGLGQLEQALETASAGTKGQPGPASSVAR